MKHRETGVFTKPRRGTKERGDRLQGYGANVSDVEMVRGMCYSSFGKRKGT